MIPIVPLVSLDYMRTYAKVSTLDDAELSGLITLSTGIYMNHCKLSEIPESWVLVNPGTSPPIEEEFTTDISIIETGAGIVFRVPTNIQTAVINGVLELNENREASVTNLFPPAVVVLLAPYRDPTFA